MCISGAGHAGMEASLCNLIEDGDVVLLGVTGVWGHRAADMARRYGADVRYVEASFGRALSQEEIKFAFETHRPRVFFVAQGDSSTGIIQQNIRELGELCRQFDCFLVVDTVASLGGTEFLMDEWKVDVVYTGSQKSLGGPAGLTPISFSKRALTHIKQRKSKPKVYYFDILLIGQYWGCYGTPRIYHHTISSTLLYGLREALAHFCAVGLIGVVRRHQECSRRLQLGIEELGLEMFVQREDERLPTVNTIKVPFGVDWKKVAEYAMRKYSVEISGGLGPTVEHVFRIGLMGENATVERVDMVLSILHEAIQSIKLRAVKAERSKI
ncbi:LOW QUALITY PROTEIN: serine--pyruvate aminotransferase, mitochondrial-like [Drosophila subobscura]|uniref:LOW QUALITY PROTEIN: serine--pyruvate aminotransferase, mitochondrial-like n=1 Tax=Drosophila subobscura TaxID=7241 RepID=UPI00155AC283|nr:LOW QUALITY PROTEIN: serine--pyruvate aminotransferase, mitochondrial-like [Drosophila subobscura]